MWIPFLHLDSLAQQLYILGPPFGVGSSGGIINCDNLFFMIGAREGGCQVSSTSGKINFGVVTGRGVNRVGMEDWKRLDTCLDRVRSLLQKCN